MESRRSGVEFGIASMGVWAAAWIVFPVAGYGGLYVALAASAGLAAAGLRQGLRRRRKLGIGLSLGVLSLSILTVLSVFSLLSVIEN